MKTKGGKNVDEQKEIILKLYERFRIPCYVEYDEEYNEFVAWVEMSEKTYWEAKQFYDADTLEYLGGKC